MTARRPSERRRRGRRAPRRGRRDRAVLPCRAAGARSATASRLVSHVSLAGDTTIGARTRIFPFAAIGHQPQDLKYRGEPVRLVVGEDCLIREGVTMNPGTEGGGSETQSRPALRSPGQRPCRARLPPRRGRHPVEQRDARRPLPDRRLRDPERRIGRRISSCASARTLSSAVLRASSTTSSLSAWRSAIAPRSPGSTIVGLKRRGFSHEAIHDLRRAYKMLFVGKGALKERARRRGGGLSRSAGGAGDRRLPAAGRRPGDLRTPRRQGRRRRERADRRARSGRGAASGHPLRSGRVPGRGRRRGAAGPDASRS